MHTDKEAGLPAYRSAADPYDLLGKPRQSLSRDEHRRLGYASNDRRAIGMR